MWKVLLVENDGLIRRAIKDDLSAHGFSVIEAEDGLVALEAIRAATPDCVIADMILPKIEGYRLVQYLRLNARYRHIPLVVVSAVPPEELAPRLAGVVVDAYVVKGPLVSMLEHLRKSLEELQRRGQAAPSEPMRFVPEGFVPRRIVSELMSHKFHYERLLERIREGIVETDEAGRIVYANQAAILLLGRDELELIGARFGDALEPKNRRRVEQLLDSVVRGEAGPSKTLLVSNREKVLRLHVDSVPGVSGTLSYAIVLEDLSFLKSILEF